MWPTIDLIFLDKRDSSLTNDWAYFRLTTVGDAIEACRVQFPAFEDIEPPIDTPGNVGLAAAYDNIAKLLLKQWSVNRDRSVLIGMRERKR